MERDAARVRAGRPFVFTALRHGEGVAPVLRHLVEIGGLDAVQDAAE
jgi:urease accessory protein